MNKKYQLHTGIKDIIQTNGTEPIRTVQLANILADYSAYDEGSPDKPGGLSIQLCKSEKKEFYIRYSS